MIHFTKESWEHYLYWQATDRSTLKKINILIRDALRSPFRGLGKPEPLKGDLAGFWSRRIDDVNRFVYKFEAEELFIVSCRFHYD